MSHAQTKTHKNTLLLLEVISRQAVLVYIGEGDCRHIGGWQVAEGGVCVRSFLLLKLYSCWFLLHWVFNYHWLLCLIQHRCLCWLFFYTPAPSCVSLSTCAHTRMHSTHVSKHAWNTHTHKHAEGVKQTSNSPFPFALLKCCLPNSDFRTCSAFNNTLAKTRGHEINKKAWHCSGGCCCSYLLTKLSSIHDGLRDLNPWCLAWLTIL